MDVAALLNAQRQRLDLDYVQEWIADFAAALDQPELQQRLAAADHEKGAILMDQDSLREASYARSPFQASPRRSYRNATRLLAAL